MYTVKQLSTLAGVTPRTLRHYDRIGLLKPETVGENGYRYYGDRSVLQLQQILFYRELGLALDAIKEIMGRRDYEVLAALESHRVQLRQRVARLQRLIETVDRTIADFTGGRKMNPQSLFEGFSEAQQEEYARQAETMYDPETVRESNRRWKGYSPEKRQAILEQGRQVYRDMIAAMPKGAGSPQAQAVVARWRAHMDHFWTPDLEQLSALARMYGVSPDFKANFDAMHPDLADFMRQAVEVYVTAHSSG